MAPRGRKPCAAPDCDQISAFRTNSRPGWCDDHITAIFNQGGLEPIEPFVDRKTQRMSRCLSCGCEAQYSYNYVGDRNRVDERVCRACFWRSWAASNRASQSRWDPTANNPVSVEETRIAAEAAGRDYLGPLTDPSLKDDPHLVRCRRCGVQKAERRAEATSPCQCTKNQGRPGGTRGPAASQPKETVPLLRESDLTAVAWWDHEANSAKDWETATERSTRKLRWLCLACGLKFTARAVDMVPEPRCPDCYPKKEAARRAELDAEREWLKDKTIADIPELLAAWAEDGIDPATVPVLKMWATGYRFRCPAGHHPRLHPTTFLGSGCPSCRSAATRAENLREALANDEPLMNAEITAQWHPSRNGQVDVRTVPATSQRTFWWRDVACGYEWQDSVTGRNSDRRLRCPRCETILDSLAYHHPGLAAEWSPDNPLSAWHVRPTGQLTFTARWLCPSDPAHSWTAPLGSRHSGSGCPHCRVSGKSKVELVYHAAAEAEFGRASSGQPLRRQEFRRGSTWTVDTYVDLSPDTGLAIEYDGSYWHRDKAALDRTKSTDLLAAGLLVVRLREHPLPSLDVDDPRYTEIVVYSATSPDPTATMQTVRSWAESAVAQTTRRQIAEPTDVSTYERTLFDTLII
jgi:hypothetical protein